MVSFGHLPSLEPFQRGYAPPDRRTRRRCVCPSSIWYDRGMAKTIVYVETTIPSFYHEDRTEPGIVARREWTRHWWVAATGRHELVTSQAVLDELAEGWPQRSADRLSLVSGLPILPVVPAIADIVEAYIQQRLMPADPLGDALHLAIASYHKCDFLVTWNCRHLANANKFSHLRRLNTILGLFVPALVTPLELLGDDDENPDDLSRS